jgi:hypothetical protein
MPASSANVPSGARVDQVVDVALHRADMVLEALGPLGLGLANTKPRYSPTPRARASPNADLSKSAAQPSGTGTVTSRPSVSKVQPW